MSTIKKKEFGTALIVWFFLGGIGVHRAWIKETPITLIWYWAANICTFGILMIVDLFLLKGMIEKKYEEDLMREKYYSQK